MNRKRLEWGYKELELSRKFLDEIEPLLAELSEDQSIYLSPWLRSLEIFGVTPDSQVVGIVLRYTKGPMERIFSVNFGDLRYRASLEFGDVCLTTDPRFCKTTKIVKPFSEPLLNTTYELDNPDCDPLFADEGRIE